MDGLTKIISKIQSDADSQCEAILSKAREQAQAILNEAKIKAEKQESIILEKAVIDANLIAEKAESACELTQKRVMLETKGNIIKEVTNDALNYLCNLEVSEYFDNIKFLVKSNALSGNGTIMFNSVDFGRIPCDFEKVVNELLDDDKSISVSNETINCKGGFVLSYDEMRVDCTFESLIEDASETIKDKLNEVLFS
jgi:V/A-type H+-transporting ATPase subunit E